MTNTKDKYAELKSTDIDQWALNILNRFEEWRFYLTQSQAKAKSQVLIASLLANLDVANQLLQKVVDDTEIGCVPRSHLNRIEAYLSNPPTDKESN